MQDFKVTIKNLLCSDFPHHSIYMIVGALTFFVVNTILKISILNIVVFPIMYGIIQYGLYTLYNFMLKDKVTDFFVDDFTVEVLYK